MRNVAIAILCDSMHFLKWQANIIRRLHGYDRCEIRAFVIYENVRTQVTKSVATRLYNYIAAVIKNTLSGSQRISLQNCEDTHTDFKETPKIVLDYEPEHVCCPDALREEALKRCRELNCDIFIDFSRRKPPSSILPIPRMGVWSYQNFKITSNNATPPGFWEFYHNHAVTKVTVRSLDSDSDRIIARGVYQTNTFSWTLNAECLLEKSSYLLSDKIIELVTLNELTVIQANIFQEFDTSCMNSAHSVHYMTAFCKALFRKALLLCNKLLFRDVWELIFSLKYDKPLRLSGFHKVSPPRGRFWADPFILERKEGAYIFFEEYNFRDRKGRIAVVQMQGSKLVYHSTIMKTPYHLSFPYVFEFEKELFMCPETNESNTVEIWKCTRFPDLWEKHAEALTNVSAADTVIFEYCSKWWLFTNIDRSTRKDHCYELWGYYSDHPIEGPWHPHGRNPLLIDARCARNAGKVAWCDGLGLVRLSQINKRGYGNGIDIRRIIKLDEQTYVEESIKKMRPVWDNRLVGLHHCDVSRNYVVFDVCRRRLRFLW